LEKKDYKFLKITTKQRIFNIDIAFVLDCTSSMNPWIDAAKNQIVHISDTLKDHNLKVGFVGFRDYGDILPQLDSMNFTNSIDGFKNKLSIIEAAGGGDTPEDLIGGLNESLNLKWSGDHRFLILISDAPCHGKEFHKLKDDRHPNGDPNGLNPQKILESLRNEDIQLIFVKIVDEDTDIMIEKFSKFYNKKPLEMKVIALGEQPDLLSDSILKVMHKIDKKYFKFNY